MRFKDWLFRDTWVANSLRNLFISLISLSACLTSACSHLSFFSTTQLDRRPSSILLLNLYDQRSGPLASDYKWKGDWLFRRERLSLVDQSLRVMKPDIVVFQDLIAKRGSPSDSDKNILARGALEGYEWQLVEERLFEDTGELSFHAVATSLPLRLQATPGQKFWPIGVDGGLSLAKIDNDGQPILIFSLKMPTQSIQLDKWYQLVMDRVLTEQKIHDVCSNRLLMVGFMPGQPSWQEFQKLLLTLGLTDSATNFCQLTKDCFTESTENEIYASSVEIPTNSRSMRVFWPKSAQIIDSRRVFNDVKVKASERSKRYEIDNLAPTQQYGWLSQARFLKCE